MRTLLATLLLIAVIPAYGSMIVVSGVTQIGAPPSLVRGALVSDTTIYGMVEQAGLVLSAPVSVGISAPGDYICCSPLSPGTIAAGTTVDSYLLYASPVSDESPYDFRQFDGEITFSPGEKIIGIIVGYQNLVATDGTLGAPGTTYPPGTYNLGGLEPNDQVIVSNNMQSVYVNLYVQTDGIDMIRILTSTPEPADFVLIGSGLLALGLFRRRLQGLLARRQH